MGSTKDEKAIAQVAAQLIEELINAGIDEDEHYRVTLDGYVVDWTLNSRYVSVTPLELRNVNRGLVAEQLLEIIDRTLGKIADAHDELAARQRVKETPDAQGNCS